MSHRTTKDELRQLRSSVAALGMRPPAHDSWASGITRAAEQRESAAPITVFDKPTPSTARSWLSMSVAWLFSTCLHAVLMVVLGLTIISPEILSKQLGLEVAILEPDVGSETLQSQVIEIESSAMEPASGGASRIATSEIAGLASVTSQIPIEVDVSDRVAGGGNIVNDVASMIGDGRELDAAGLGDGTGEGAGIGDGQGGSGEGDGYAMFYGSEARGKSFAFVVDCSQSMTGRRWEMALRELMSSVVGMETDQKFYVVFFNTEDFPQYYPVMDNFLSKAEPDNVDKLAKWMRNVLPMGGTNPAKALRRAMELEPDAIFLLSDGEFDIRPSMQVLFENQHVKTVIHSVALGSRAGEPMLAMLAQATGGTYRFVDVW